MKSSNKNGESRETAKEEVKCGIFYLECTACMWEMYRGGLYMSQNAKIPGKMQELLI